MLFRRSAHSLPVDVNLAVAAVHSIRFGFSFRYLMIWLYFGCVCFFLLVLFLCRTALPSHASDGGGELFQADETIGFFFYLKKEYFVFFSLYFIPHNTLLDSVYSLAYIRTLT